MDNHHHHQDEPSLNESGPTSKKYTKSRYFTRMLTNIVIITLMFAGAFYNGLVSKYKFNQ